MGMPPTDEPQIALGHAIQQVREASGMSPQELADRAAVEVDLVTEIEAGTTDTADWNTVARLSRAAGSSLAETAALAERLEAAQKSPVTEETGKRKGANVKLTKGGQALLPVVQLAKCG